jgi:phosphate transport system permease protein
MTAAMTNAAGGTDAVKVGPPFDVLFFVGLLLFVVTLLLNLVGARFVARVREKY